MPKMASSEYSLRPHGLMSDSIKVKKMERVKPEQKNKPCRTNNQRMI